MFAQSVFSLLRASGSSASTLCLRNVARPSTFTFRSISTSRVNYAGRWVYLGNLPWRVELEDIKDRAEQFGALESITMPEDESGRFSGFANVEFRSEEDAAKFFNFAKENEIEFQGRRSRVELFDAAQTEVVRNAVKRYTTTPPTDTLFLGGIPFEATEDELTELFSPFGELKRVVLAKDSENNLRGYGHVQFESLEDAQAAVRRSQEEPFTLYNRRIRIDFANPKREDPPSNKLYFNQFAGDMTEVYELLKDFTSRIKSIQSLNNNNGIIECYNTEDAVQIRSQFDKTTTPAGHQLNIFFSRPRKQFSESNDSNPRRRSSYGSDWGGSRRTSDYGGGSRGGSRSGRFDA